MGNSSKIPPHLRKDPASSDGTLNMDTNEQEYDRYEGLTEEEYQNLFPTQKEEVFGPEEVVPF
jgi:hypothetical protein